MKEKMNKNITVKKLYAKPDGEGTEEYITNPEKCLDILEKLRREAQHFIYGVSFDDAITNCIRGRYGDILVNFIEKKELIKNKKASGRDQDIVDAKKLENT